MKRNAHQKRLKRQLSRHIDGVVTGYAQETHCRQAVAELDAQEVLRDILREMEGRETC